MRHYRRRRQVLALLLPEWLVTFLAESGDQPDIASAALAVAARAAAARGRAEVGQAAFVASHEFAIYDGSARRQLRRRAANACSCRARSKAFLLKMATRRLSLSSCTRQASTFTVPIFAAANTCVSGAVSGAPLKVLEHNPLISLVGAGRFRTPDPLLPKQVRYQAALRSARPTTSRRRGSRWRVGVYSGRLGCLQAVVGAPSGDLGGGRTTSGDQKWWPTSRAPTPSALCEPRSRRSRDGFSNQQQHRPGPAVAGVADARGRHVARPGQTIVPIARAVSPLPGRGRGRR